MNNWSAYLVISQVWATASYMLEGRDYYISIVVGSLFLVLAVVDLINSSRGD